MKRIQSAAVLVLGVCISVRLGAALIAPLLPALIVLAFVSGLLVWLVGKR